MGHLVCFPHYGPARRKNARRDSRTRRSRVRRMAADAADPDRCARRLTFFYGADLPKTQYKIERAVTLRPGETSCTSRSGLRISPAYDRPVQPQSARDVWRTVRDAGTQRARHVRHARHYGSSAHGGRQVGRRSDLPVAGRAAQGWRSLCRCATFTRSPAGRCIRPCSPMLVKAVELVHASTTPITRCSSGTCFRRAIIRGLSTGRISLALTLRQEQRAESNSARLRSTKACERASSGHTCSESRPTSSSARASAYRRRSRCSFGRFRRFPQV